MRLANPGAVRRKRGGCSAVGSAASLLFVITLVAADLARADEPPAFRRGLWQFDRTVGGQALQTQSCSSPSEDMERQNALLEKVLQTPPGAPVTRPNCLAPLEIRFE